jgi:hypothetical protein
MLANLGILGAGTLLVVAVAAAEDRAGRILSLPA